MAKVHVPTPLREFTDGQIKVNVEGATVREVVAKLEARFPGLQNRLVQQGDLRPGLAVFVDARTAAAGCARSCARTARCSFSNPSGAVP